jgi:hypothetical protein
MNKVKPVLVIALVVAMFAIAPQVTMAQEGAPAEQSEIAKMVTSAKTAEDHRKIAEYYQKAAAKAKQKALDLNALGDCYKKKSMEGEAAGGKARRECGLQALQYRKIAQEDEALAKMHLEMAAKLEKEAKK